MTKGVIAGNFDVIHPGYIEMFKEMKKNCTVLIVLLHTDPSIERPHKLKPILSSDERKEILQSLNHEELTIKLNTPARAVTIEPNDDLNNTIALIMPIMLTDE